MAEKHEIVIKEHKIRYGSFKMFNISLETMQLYAPATFDLFAFNNKGYFKKLLQNFKGVDKSCYLLFRSLTWGEPGAGGASLEGIKKVLDLSENYLTLIRVNPGESRLFKRLGEEIHVAILNDESFAKIQRIINSIDSKGTWGVFIFAPHAARDNLFTNIERLFRNNSLGNQKNLLALGFDMIKFGTQGLWAEYEIDIFTGRYNAEQVRDLLLNAIDKEKFEVILK